MIKFFRIFLLLLFLPVFLCGKSTEWERNVKRSKDSVLIKGIPQVDQRGSFCVPGSVSMIIQYFDSGMTQDRLARLFESDICKGTDINDMLQGFSGRKLFDDFSIDEIYSLYRNNEEYAALFEAYIDFKNRNSLRKQNLRDRELRQLYASTNIFAAMDPEIARKAFAESRTELRSLLTQTIKENINAGIPILWEVMMRFDPRDGRPEGHVRVIVGYVEKNSKIERVIYSDSWGNRSFERHVLLNDALAMTSGLYLIKPKDPHRQQTGAYALLPRNIALELVPVPACAHSDAFYIGKYEVTQQQYRVLVGKNFSENKGEDFPVEKVTWEEAIEFCKKLTLRERKAGRISENQFYTLPTKAQWLYACTADESLDAKLFDYDLTTEIAPRPHTTSLTTARAGLFNQFKKSVPNPLEDFAWIFSNSSGKTHPVGKKHPGKFGIYDMHGNVSEWCREGCVLGVNYTGEGRAQNYWGGVNSRQFRFPSIGFRVVLITHIPQKSKK